MGSDGGVTRMPWTEKGLGQPVKPRAMAHSIGSGLVQLTLMDRVCSELVEAEMVLHSVAHVSGECFI